VRECGRNACKITDPSSTAYTRIMLNADPAELAKFGALAHRWWDPGSDFKPLHDINPLRLDYIERRSGGLAGRRTLDVGCGGGILAEAMARAGAKVTGIDLSDRALAVARLHQLESGVDVDYRLSAAETLATEAPASFDVVTCMELLEHVPDPASTVAACAKLVRVGGLVVFSTINRNPKAYLFAVIGGEYVLRLLPRGTHDYARFLKPSELAAFGRSAGLEPDDLVGMTYNPLAKTYRLEADTSVNYIATFRRDV
jgi:2-polyprenyl-6-hydroxyphenyl methylase / 3-demethylubiquinone-9 3-methyltransferase